MNIFSHIQANLMKSLMISFDRVSFRPVLPPPGSWSSRRAIPATAISRQMPPWFWPRTRGRSRAICRPARQSPCAGLGVYRGHCRRAWLHQSLAPRPRCSRRVVAEVVQSPSSTSARSALGQARKVNVEYVSANPQGTCMWVIAGGAVFGDALATFCLCGARVTRNTTSTMPAPRSMCSARLCVPCGIARRWATRSERSPRACIRAII